MNSAQHKDYFPGSRCACNGLFRSECRDIKAKLQWQTIGPDKINQLRHVRYFKDINGMKEYMKKHAEIIRPKFEAVLETLEKELGELGIASWSKPVGGYFISFNAQKGCAKAIVAKCKEAGLVLTGAGAAYPYGNDPEDSNIRIAPTLPSTEELSIATALFVTCTKLVTIGEASCRDVMSDEFKNTPVSSSQSAFDLHDLNLAE